MRKAQRKVRDAWKNDVATMLDGVEPESYPLELSARRFNTKRFQK